MSLTYTTGEMAKLAEVSVRTVQYYDKRGILQPSSLTEGGRRLYSQADLDRLQIICFLRELDFSIEQIRSVLTEDNAGQVLEMLLEDQISRLKAEVSDKKTKLDRTVKLLNGLGRNQFNSLDYLNDISRLMKNKDNWRRLQWWFYPRLFTVIALYGLGIYLATVVFESKWLMWLSIAVFLMVLNGLIYSYVLKIEYLCPVCHKTFAPSFKEFAVAGHTPRTRKVTCPHCKTKSYCLELAKEV
ncbi:MerR family transcriptional regulator [Streptococcus moroccensis]|uniref:DNA-binding transcriptional MerR regulator/DNA-directed RNA polymerase subunit RPC12/RpoP n=1 Tax=Streptococcus moroccensis TaxID=1451356 RepID=A0ABT9YSG9_9STRE|nr:MerR family transcriptional regulator [Streptococcus moroccensis]MDQ0222941.1 DNA-binding transcriptional MerR regulator/DNA-directed RNA polymerase subunit RPC12/RpoP [Streptococcus moroccensis]